MQKLLVLLFVPLLFSNVQTTEISQSTDLHALVRSGEVKCEILTNGGYNESSIKLKLINSGKGRRVLIPAGTRFTSSLSEEQDLVIPEDLIVALPRNTDKEYNVDAYCVQQSNLSPSEGESFGLSKETDQDLLKVLNFMSGKEFETDIIQDAIWSVTDGSSIASIDRSNPKCEELRKYLSEITGQEDVWYDLDRDHYANESREIVAETKEVSGNIAYEATQTGSVKMQVTTEEGRVIRELGGGMPISRLGKYKFRFSMKVQGWDQGVYFVQLKLGDNVFH